MSYKEFCEFKAALMLELDEDGIVRAIAAGESMGAEVWRAINEALALANVPASLSEACTNEVYGFYLEFSFTAFPLKRHMTDIYNALLLLDQRVVSGKRFSVVDETGTYSENGSGETTFGLYEAECILNHEIQSGGEDYYLLEVEENTASYFIN